MKYDRAVNGEVAVEAASDTIDPYSPDAPRKLFDITKVVGTVYSGGDMDPRHAAFLTIAEDGTDGTFNFPNKDGTLIHVTVKTDLPQERDGHGKVTVG